MPADPKRQVEEVLDLERQLSDAETEIMKIEQFKNFLQFQKETKQKIDLFWSTVETEMIAANVKSIKGDWGSVTIAERINWKVDLETLPSKFIKKVADTTKISNFFKLEGKPPKGAEPTYKKFITKRIK